MNIFYKNTRDAKMEPDKLDVLLSKEDTWKAWVITELLHLHEEMDSIKKSNERQFQLILAMLGVLITILLTIIGWFITVK